MYHFYLIATVKSGICCFKWKKIAEIVINKGTNLAKYIGKNYNIFMGLCTLVPGVYFILVDSLVQNIIDMQLTPVLSRPGHYVAKAKIYVCINCVFLNWLVPQTMQIFKKFGKK